MASLQKALLTPGVVLMTFMIMDGCAFFGLKIEGTFPCHL